jgi:predicted lipoprotein with Yx(FWY)xxD motif
MPPKEKKMRKSLYVVVLAASAAFAVSACGVDLTPTKGPAADAARAEEAPAPAGPAEPAASEPAPSESASPTPAGPLVKAAEIALGTIVTTAEGLPLYRFDQDSASPSRSTCYNACAQKFRAYPWVADLKLEGIDKKYIGRVQRTDGSWQLTINKWPVYTSAADAPGEWKGHGSGGAWWLVTPEGKKVPAAKPSPGSTY